MDIKEGQKYWILQLSGLYGVYDTYLLQVHTAKFLKGNPNGRYHHKYDKWIFETANKRYIKLNVSTMIENDFEIPIYINNKECIFYESQSEAELGLIKELDNVIKNVTEKTNNLKSKFIEQFGELKKHIEFQKGLKKQYHIK